MDTNRELLRHTVATLAYRAGKVLRGGSDEIAGFRAGQGARTPGELLAHVGDLMDWAWNMARGEPAWNSSTPLPWDQEVERFYASLKRFDDYLASDGPLGSPAEKLFQGPVADALTHVGQIGMLRRLAGAPIRSENYFKAGIASGRVGSEQEAPRFEFD